MDKSIKKKVAFPRYAEYNCAIKYFIEKGLDVTCVLPPALSDHTLEIGAKYSPDFVCTPFKTLLGSLIEALEAGADTLVMVYGMCKLGYYGELQEQILRELGYNFEFVNLSIYDTGKTRDILKGIMQINPKAKYPKMLIALVEGIAMAEHLDEVTGLYFQNMGFEVEKGAYQKAYRHFLAGMYSASNIADIERCYHKVRKDFAKIEINKPKKPLRVGIIGEFYTAMDAFSNLEVEKKLASLGVEIHRRMTVTNRMLRYAGEDNLHVKIKDYCKFEMGPTSTLNLWSAVNYAEQGFDGIIHIKSANCTPEIDIMPVLRNVSDDYKIPILYLTFDSQTSDVGLMTRLEAFYDMISWKI